MLNNIDNTSFKARFVMTAPIKDAARMKNIQNIFSENTKSYKDTLTLTKINDVSSELDLIYLGNKIEDSLTVAFKEPFDSMMEKFSDNEIATKLVKALKTLKALGRRDCEILGLESSAYRAEHEKNRNSLIAKNFRADGNESMAKRFDYLANCFEKQIEKINQQQQEADSKFLSRLKEIADGDQDVLYFSSAM